MTARYWEIETPTIEKTCKNTLTYYEQAGKLQVSGADWITPDGKPARGKTVVLDLRALAVNREAVTLLKGIVNTLDAQSAQQTQ